MKKVLLAGYYGFGNLGDEAILEMALEQILEITERNNITILSGNKEATRKKYNIDTIDRYNVFSIIKKLKSSDVLVFGGGSLLQDVTSKRSIYYYLFLIRLAKFMNNKIVMLSQGIGPIINEKSKSAVSSTLRMVNYITVRDKHSKEFLESLGVDKKKIFLSTDPVINLRTGKIIKKQQNCTKKVCFSLRNWKNANVSEKISQVADKLIKNGIECHFIPFYYNEDLELINEVEKNIGTKAVYYKERLSTREAFDIIINMDVMVGVRLHSLIFAAAANVPFVAVSYDHKVDHFVNSVSMKVACKIDNIDVELLCDEIIKKIENEDEEKKILQESVLKLRELTNINYKILKEI
ncbi:MAG: polysaccharide pyruvyl transferase CsaB [Sedimentibacter sp.]|uniref:polysaccharide pyruvyl transferase CsaB n=1 Tax=Sedimentibacter sp. TaxID=1960295 RepID=UPI002980F6FC|nr:polysaccharide pyruvyl transferase CsaB [Sedimentibacter sp.]MDW5299288.1 polysaccharide pyruvyl transferase CsaB [Sedimentibacter sp.]